MNTRENVGLLPNETGDLFTWDREKAEVLDFFFALAAPLARLALGIPRSQRPGGESGTRKVYP